MAIKLLSAARRKGLLPRWRDRVSDALLLGVAIALGAPQPAFCANGLFWKRYSGADFDSLSPDGFEPIGSAASDPKPCFKVYLQDFADIRQREAVRQSLQEVCRVVRDEEFWKKLDSETLWYRLAGSPLAPLQSEAVKSYLKHFFTASVPRSFRVVPWRVSPRGCRTPAETKIESMTVAVKACQIERWSALGQSIDLHQEQLTNTLAHEMTHLIADKLFSPERGNPAGQVFQDRGYTTATVNDLVSYKFGELVECYALTKRIPSTDWATCRRDVQARSR